MATTPGAVTHAERRSARLLPRNPIDVRNVKLGKRVAHHDSRVPMLAKYLASLQTLPTPPVEENWADKITKLGMMMNDKLGDCTCAAVGHVIQQWTAESGTQAIIPDQDILTMYEAVSGYNPSDPNTDAGAIELDVLKYWLNHPLDGHELLAFVALEPSNHTNIKDAIYIFGNAYIGLQLPLSAQNQAVWSVPAGGAHGEGAPGSWGGHAVPIIGYDDATLTCITWGTYQQMTWAFWEAYCDEAYALLSKDWLTQAAQVTPAGFDFKTLQADMDVLKR